MTLYVLRRLGLLLVAIFVTSIIVFLLLRLLPGDLARVIGGTEATPEQIEAIRGRARPRPVVGRAVPRLDQRHPARRLRRVAAQRRVGPTSWREAHRDRAARAVLDGAVDRRRRPARHRRRRPSPQGRRCRAVVVSQLGIAVPSFWVGLMLMVVFVGEVGAPPGPGLPARRVGRPGRALQSLVLPTITLAIAAGRGAVALRALGDARRAAQDYIRTARAKGLTRTQALFRHGLRNASLPDHLDPRRPDRQPDRRCRS